MHAEEVISNADPDGKLRVFSISQAEASCGRYVHAKTWIVDDELALIGSANLNRRGMSHDREIAAAVFDPSVSYQLTYTFAHRLRMRLWAHQLGMNTPEQLAELSDGVASRCHWLQLTSSARVVPYDRFIKPEQSVWKSIKERAISFGVDPAVE